MGGGWSEAMGMQRRALPGASPEQGIRCQGRGRRPGNVQTLYATGQVRHRPSHPLKFEHPGRRLRGDEDISWRPQLAYIATKTPPIHDSRTSWTGQHASKDIYDTPSHSDFNVTLFVDVRISTTSINSGAPNPLQTFTIIGLLHLDFLAFFQPRFLQPFLTLPPA
ncbi:hypothetical protein OF83DRAFT_1083194 [Amylostereum chailletii]|nr:hypothetical protein OF83DRAFT_1083194 [Amylostereum chailletii]